MDSVMNFEKSVQSHLDTVLSNPYVMAILKISLIIYAAQIAPKSPVLLQGFFQNTFVKILSIALIAYLVKIDFQLSIILAIIFVLGSNYLSGRSLLESYGNTFRNEQPGPFFSDQTLYNNLLGQPAVVGTATLLDSQTDNYSGCENVKLADLLAIFDNDYSKIQSHVMYAFKDLMTQLPPSDSKMKLESIARAAGLPYNIKINDYNAPLIATILLNYGFVISQTCQPPSGDAMFASAPLPAFLAVAQQVQAAAGTKPRQ